ncbi:MAG: spore cortex biosynthesis protein YabQ [Candidatus Flemingiibacterium sp.]
MIIWNSSEMWATLLYSLIVGAALGALWDIIRVPRLMLSGRFELIAAFFGDILFFTLAGITMTIFVFETCYGLARGYALFGAAAGFIVWRLTLGRLTLIACRSINRLIKKFARFVLGKILLPSARAIGRLFAGLWRLTLGRLASALKNRWKKARNKREAERLVRFCRTLAEKTEESYYALDKNEHTGKARGILRVRLSDNNLCERTDKVQRSERGAGKLKRPHRNGERLN